MMMMTSFLTLQLCTGAWSGDMPGNAAWSGLCHGHHCHRHGRSHGHGHHHHHRHHHRHRHGHWHRHRHSPPHSHKLNNRKSSLREKRRQMMTKRKLSRRWLLFSGEAWPLFKMCKSSSFLACSPETEWRWETQFCRNWVFMMFAVSNFLTSLGYPIPYTFVPVNILKTSFCFADPICQDLLFVCMSRCAG